MNLTHQLFALLAKTLYSSALLFFTLVVGLSIATSVSAQEMGVSISPATFDETLDPGTEKQYSISIQNLDAQDQTYYLHTRNISGVRDGGVPVFTQAHTEKTGFELVDWISLPASEIIVPGDGVANFDFTLIVPGDAAPGSHLGGVFFSVLPPEIERSGVAVGYQIASLMHIRVTGDVVEQANIRHFSTQKFLHGSQNVDFKVSIQNTGNVVVRPTGPLEIYNMLGDKVGSVTFNESRSLTLPTSEREYSALNWTGEAVGFGRYQAVLSPSYGEAGAYKTISSSVTFWVLPMRVIGPALGVLVVVLLLLTIFVRLYIRRTTAHLDQGRGLLLKRRKGGFGTLLLLPLVAVVVVSLFFSLLLTLFA